MSKKYREQLSEEITEMYDIVAEEPVVEAILEPVEVAPEAPAVEEPVVAEAYQEPTLMIQEVALKCIKGFKSHHLAAILAFAKSKGYAVSGTEAEMKSVLRSYGFEL